MQESGRSWTARVPNIDRLELASSLTLILLLLHSPGFWYVRSPLVVLAICGLVNRRVKASATFWMFVTAFLGATLYLNWFTADNHKFLEVYWCLALCCVFSVPESERLEVLETNGRLLIGLCMLFSVFWKIHSSTFLNGAFFEFALLTDDRFENLAAWCGHVPRFDLIHNRELERMLVLGFLEGSQTAQVPLASTPQIQTLAVLMTWWTITEVP